MEFYGDTLAEALHKAVNYGKTVKKPVSINRKRPISSYRSKTRQTLKHRQHDAIGLTGRVLQDFLRPMRDAAIDRAKSWLAVRYDPDSSEEIGYYELFFPLTGEHRTRSGDQAGNSCTDSEGNPHFCFRFPVRRDYEILVAGHSHPDSASVGRTTVRNSMRDERRSGDDQILNAYCPLVIATPNRPQGREFDFRQRYRPFSRWTRNRGE